MHHLYDVYYSCGIVLCSRDAKFAVDCDTCRLSYCLVCLASGSKDPCVRCGHRPSKRMEQLVHLRLKSIYKAFKQSSSKKDGSNNTTTIEELEDDMDAHHTHNSHHHHHDNSEGGLFHDHEDSSGTTNPILQAAAAAAASSKHRDSFHGSGVVLAEKFMAEKQKADAAAEALLAELEEEEDKVKSKQSKKKRKKEREAAKKRAEQEQLEMEQHQKELQQKRKQQQSSRKQQLLSQDEDGSKSSKTTPKKGGKAQHDNKAVSSSDTASTPRQSHSPHEDEEMESPPSKVDPMEQKLCQAVEDCDEDAIEDLLFELKGVPGRAALRKNAKKALKRMKSNVTEDTAAAAAAAGNTDSDNAPELTPAVPTTTFTTKAHVALMNTTNSNTVPASELLKVVSDNNVGISSMGTGSGATRHHHNAGHHHHHHHQKAECVMQMSPAVIGWVIGKGGQRIRDLMEESGAKVWIDQEKIIKSVNESRNVYVSGERKSVDQAVRMIKDIVSKAPIVVGSTAADSPAPVAAETPGIAAAPAPAAPAKLDATEQQQQRSQVHSAPSSLDHVKSLQQNQIAQQPVATAVVQPPTKTVPPRNPQEGSTPPLPSMVQHQQPLAAVTSTEDDNMIVTAEHVLTCEARFVPLLIGKRGWTIKHIQDVSNARVDIDQTVTPRRIRISGSKTNVETAVGMVRDVLSYPHAQLQQQQEKYAAANSSRPAIPNAMMMTEDANNNNTDERNHSPPSQLIMTGDAKSSISASSSLSSTPEPSMTSTSKGYGAAPPLHAGPLIPPPDQYNATAANHHLQAQAFLQQQQHGMGMAAATNGGARFGPPFSGLMGMQHHPPMPGMGMPHPHHIQPHPHQMYNPTAPPPKPMGANTNVIQDQSLSFGGPGMSTSLTAARSDSTNNNNLLTPVDFGTIARNIATHQQHPTAPAAAPQAYSLQENALRKIMPTGGNLGRTAPNPSVFDGHSDLPGGGGLWNTNPSKYPGLPQAAPAPTSEAFYSMDALARPRADDRQEGSTSIRLGFEVGAGGGKTTTAATAPFSALDPASNVLGVRGSGRDDAQLIDSMFAQMGDSQQGTSSLLTGLHGLSLDNGDKLGSATGLWGDTPLSSDWDSKNNNLGAAASNAASKNSTDTSSGLLAGLQPLNVSSSDQHPPQSRFNWSSTNA